MLWSLYFIHESDYVLMCVCIHGVAMFFCIERGGACEHV